MNDGHAILSHCNIRDQIDDLYRTESRRVFASLVRI